MDCIRSGEGQCIVFQSTESIDNDRQAKHHPIILEPWGKPLNLAPGHRLKMVADADTEGCLEIVHADDVTLVYAWAGAAAGVYDGN